MSMQSRGVGATLGMVLVMLAGACSNGDGKGAGDSTAAATLGSDVAAAMDPPDFGKPDGNPCALVAGSGRCTGYSPLDFTLPENSNAAGKFLEGIRNQGNWRGPSNPTPRKVKNGQPDAKHMIRVIKDAAAIPFKDFKTGSMVMARIDVPRGAGTDERYGIAPDPTGDRNQIFFLVVDSPNLESGKVNEGYRFARWRIYAKKKDSSNNDIIVQVGNTGAFRWCDMSHSSWKKGNGARYLTCPGARSATLIANNIADADSTFRFSGDSLLAAIENELQRAGNKALTEQAVRDALNSILRLKSNAPSALATVVTPADVKELFKILQDQPGDPAWMLCGVGCCTADFS